MIQGVFLKGISIRCAPRAVFLLSATVLAALAVTGCMSSTSAGSSGTSTAAAPQSASASKPAASASSAVSLPPAAAPTTTSSPPPAAASQTPAVAGPPSSATVPAAAAPVTYTFPDGRLSFAHPAGWRVEPAGDAESPSAVNWTVYDASGSERVRIFYSEVGGAATGPLTRTVFYSEPVPGLQGHSGPAVVHASFFVDNIYGEPHYRMALTGGAAVSPEGGQAADVVIVGGNRVLAATVVFTGGPFAGDDAAKVWFGGEEGQALKALLMSFSYR